MGQALQVNLFSPISWHSMIIIQLIIVIGFYYVCVDFNPQASISSTTTSVSQSAPSEEGIQPMNSTKGEGRQRTRRDSSVRRREASPTPLSAPVATMSGFYYHQNSEPWVGIGNFAFHYILSKKTTRFFFLSQISTAFSDAHTRTHEFEFWIPLKRKFPFSRLLREEPAFIVMTWSCWRLDLSPYAGGFLRYIIPHFVFVILSLFSTIQT